MRIRQPTPAPVVPIHTSLPRKVTSEPKEVNNYLVPLTNVCKESKSSPRLNCVESATCESQQ